jgi:hypothetical protein
LALAVAKATGGEDSPHIDQIDGELHSNGIDLNVSATLNFASGLSARISTSITEELCRSATIVGEYGRLRFCDPFFPGGDRLGTIAQLEIDIGGQKRGEDIGSDFDCYGLEAMEVSRLIQSAHKEPSWPMVAPFESNQIATLIETWGRTLHSKIRSD